MNTRGYPGTITIMHTASKIFQFNWLAITKPQELCNPFCRTGSTLSTLSDIGQFHTCIDMHYTTSAIACNCALFTGGR